MIYGIGVDTTSAQRIEKAMQRKSFINKVFGENEMQFLNARKNSTLGAAANFAAKEAFSKALGTGIFTSDFKLNEVEILRKETGEPYFYFTGDAKKIIELKNLTAYVSLTHEQNTATAFVILEQTTKEKDNDNT